MRAGSSLCALPGIILLRRGKRCGCNGSSHGMRRGRQLLRLRERWGERLLLRLGLEREMYLENCSQALLDHNLQSLQFISAYLTWRTAVQLVLFLHTTSHTASVFVRYEWNVVTLRVLILVVLRPRNLPVVLYATGKLATAFVRYYELLRYLKRWGVMR